VKLTLGDLANLQNENTAVGTLSANNTATELAMENTLSRDGTSPNQMEAVLDMNSNRVVNLPEPISNTEPVRLVDLLAYDDGSLTISPLPIGGTTGQLLGKVSGTDYDVAWEDAPVVAEPYASTPEMNGSASAGSSADYSRGDHVHPVDTSRAPLASPTFTGVPAGPTASLGTNTTQLATTAFVIANAPAPAAGTTIGKQINGLVPANNAVTPLTKLDVSAGNARSSDLTTDIVLSVGITKIEGAWAVGTGNGGLDSGSTFAANTSYHIYVIYHPTGPVVDILFSTSATAPTMPSGYTKKRRIGTFQTDSAGDIVKAQWRADGSVQYVFPIAILTRTLGSISLLTLAPSTPAAGIAGTVPLGIKVKIRTQIVLFNSGADNSFYGIVRDPDTGAPANDANLGQFGVAYRAAGTTLVTMVEDFSSTAGQVYTASYPAAAANAMHLYIHGYTDLRDEFA
jgi:hypothetical protein